jgi:hypothetical protein
MTVKKTQHRKTFEQRTADIDRGHKLVASEAAMEAMKNGAIAAEWHSHYRQPGYDYRLEHKERDGKIYAIRGNWAIERGLMNKGAGYTDEITAPAEEHLCRCYYTYLNNIRDLPEDMLTEKGKQYLADEKPLAALNRRKLRPVLLGTPRRTKADQASKRPAESALNAKAVRPLHTSVLRRIVRYLLSGWLREKT